ncbi:MAG: right-handed parallel beta-helix repeat-containing protein [Promethearchaeota archaeon]
MSQKILKVKHQKIKHYAWLRLVILGVILGISMLNFNECGPPSQLLAEPTITSPMEQPSGADPVAPIIFDGNAAVDTYCADLPGTGTDGDPYIIENLVFSHELIVSRVIDIIDVTRHILFRNLSVDAPYDYNENNFKILLRNSANLTFEICELGEMYVDNVNYTAFTECNISESLYWNKGNNISISNSHFPPSTVIQIVSNLTVLGNWFLHSEWLRIENCINCTFSQNTIYHYEGGQFEGLFIYGDYGTIQENYIQNCVLSTHISFENTNGIAAYDSKNYTISGNSIDGFGKSGIQISNMFNSSIYENYLGNNTIDIFDLGGSINVQIWGNVYEIWPPATPLWITPSQTIFGDPTVELHWNAVEGAENYGLWMNETQIITTSGLHYLHTFSEAGLYNFTLKAWNFTGWSDFSAPLEIAHIPNDNDENPMISAPDITQFYDSQLPFEYSWTIHDNTTAITHYDIYINDILEKSGSWVSGDSVNLILSNLAVGSYNIELIAYDGLEGETTYGAWLEILFNNLPFIGNIEEKIYAPVSLMPIQLDWSIEDPNTDYNNTWYEFTIDGEVMTSGKWESGTVHEFILPVLEIGEYSCNIEVDDGLGGIVVSEFILIVTDQSFEEIPGYSWGILFGSGAIVVGVMESYILARKRHKEIYT